MLFVEQPGYTESVKKCHATICRSICPGLAGHYGNDNLLIDASLCFIYQNKALPQGLNLAYPPGISICLDFRKDFFFKAFLISSYEHPSEADFMIPRDWWLHPESAGQHWVWQERQGLDPPQAGEANRCHPGRQKQTNPCYKFCKPWQAFWSLSFADSIKGRVQHLKTLKVQPLSILGRF